MATEVLKVKCSDGFTKDDPMVSPKARYSKMGLFWLSMAFSAMPEEIIFQCQKCGEILERTDDPELLRKYRFNSEIFKS